MGLLITELVTNSIKHAFPDAEPGEVTLQITKQDETVRIEYADTGIGMAATTASRMPGATAARAPGDEFGLQLIEMLVSQIKGTLEVRNDTGTRYVIAFPGYSLRRLRKYTPNVMHYPLEIRQGTVCRRSTGRVTGPFGPVSFAQPRYAG